MRVSDHRSKRTCRFDALSPNSSYANVHFYYKGNVYTKITKSKTLCGMRDFNAVDIRTGIRESFHDHDIVEYIMDLELNILE